MTPTSLNAHVQSVILCSYVIVMSRKERDPTHVEYYRIRSHVRSIMLEATCTVKKALNHASLLPARLPATDVDDYTQIDSLSDDDAILLVPDIPTAADPPGIVEAVPTLNKRATWWW